MNVFVAGIHGVGKTHLASKAAVLAQLKHTSAGSLIKEERSSATWTQDKRVSDIDANQAALITAVKRYNDAQTRLLLDGHFVLLDSNGLMAPLAAEVFSGLNLCHVVLIETSPEIVATRIKERDNQDVDSEFTSRFMAAEREHACEVCAQLRTPLTILRSPDLEAFSAAISAFS